MTKVPQVRRQTGQSVIVEAEETHDPGGAGEVWPGPAFQVGIVQVAQREVNAGLRGTRSPGGPVLLRVAWCWIHKGGVTGNGELFVLLLHLYFFV